MTRLIALAALPAGTVTGVETDIQEGAGFDVVPDVADALVKDGKAKLDDPKASATSAKSSSVRARLLMDCEHGRCNDVVTLPADIVKALTAGGMADANKDAVAYAMTLEQNKPKK